MQSFIPQSIKNLIIFLCLFGVLAACDASTSAHLSEYKKQTFTLPSGDTFEAYVAVTGDQQKKGLSGIKPQHFDASKAMLFPARRMYLRQFWMPDTHFDMDVIFMNQDYYILDIHRNLKHHPFKIKDRSVPLSKEVYSQHVLEVKANSELAKKLKPGMLLKTK